MCRGHDYERLEAFQQRMLNEFPHAIAMQHANQPDETIFQAEAQCIHTWKGWILTRSHWPLAAQCFRHWPLVNSPVSPSFFLIILILAWLLPNRIMLGILIMSVEKKSLKDSVKRILFSL